MDAACCCTSRSARSSQAREWSRASCAGLFVHGPASRCDRANGARRSGAESEFPRDCLRVPHLAGARQHDALRDAELGQRNAALSLLEEAKRTGEWQMTYASVDPGFDSLRRASALSPLRLSAVENRHAWAPLRSPSAARALESVLIRRIRHSAPHSIAQQRRFRRRPPVPAVPDRFAIGCTHQLRRKRQRRIVRGHRSDQHGPCADRDRDFRSAAPMMLSGFRSR